MGTTCRIQSLQAAKGERYSRVRIEGGKGLTSKLPSPLSRLVWVMFVGKSSSCLVAIQTNHRWLASRSSLMRCIASPDLRSSFTALHLTLPCKGRCMRSAATGRMPKRIWSTFPEASGLGAKDTEIGQERSRVKGMKGRFLNADATLGLLHIFSGRMYS